jgi:hypothetical protein
MFEGPKSIISAIAGILLVALGGIPLLNSIGIISWSIPELPLIVLLIILAVGGFYLFIDGVFQFALNPSIAWVSLLLGALFGTAGVLRILNMLTSVLGWIQGTVINVLFVVIGFLLFIGAFMF